MLNYYFTKIIYNLHNNSRSKRNLQQSNIKKKYNALLPIRTK